MKRIFTYMLMAVAMIASVSCNQQKTRKTLLPNISGKPGEVIVVIDKGDWEGAPGTILRDSLGCDFPFLPQREPLYDVVNVPPKGFTNMFQIHRNIIIMNISSSVVDPGVVFKQDLWAAPQCVIRINAATPEEAVELFKENCTKIKAVLTHSEINRVIANTKKYEELGLAPIVTEMIGGSPHFPSGYKLKKKTSDFIWITYATQYTQQSILIHKYPVVEGENMMDPDNLIAAQNAMLKANVPGMFENTYMIISPVIRPSVNYKKYGEHEFAEIRGLWEVHNDYMGGPFVTHVFYSPDGKEMIMMQVFVYAPKYDKRNYLKQVESVLYSFEWKKED